MMDLKKFLARQLNDHEDSPSGVKQATYFEWTEGHICDAIQLGMCYLFSLIPQEFSKLTTHTVTEETCIVDLSDQCERFINLANMSIGDNDCVYLNQEEESNDDSIDLLPLLGELCLPEGVKLDADEEDNKYDWTVVDGSKAVLKFKPAIPAGTVLQYLCAPTPDIEDLDNSTMCQYHSMIADHALWWLYRTDSESRSNLERARLHFEGLKFFVETKLLLEFSLREDDYNYSRKKVGSGEPRY